MSRRRDFESEGRSTPGGGSGADPEGPSLLTDDRRSVLRYRAVVGRAWVGWWEGREFDRVAAWILDISGGGCLVATDGEPGRVRSVLLRLDGPFLPCWYEAEVVAVRRANTRHCAVHLRFPGGCPYELYMGVAYGRFGSKSLPPPLPQPGRADPRRPHDAP